MFVEIIVGWLTNSLGLISDAGHMFFDNASLFIGLYASYMARWAPDARYTYGYGRYEVLAGFVNGVFLVFVAVSIVLEGIERLKSPPEIHGEHVLPVSVAGLLVNLLGLVFFHDAAHGHGGGGHGHSHGGGHGHSHGGGGGGANENMYGVWLHVLADALGSVGVIISSLLIQWYGWHMADPITSIIISLLILASTVPLVQATAGPLLSRVPEGKERALARAVETVSRLPDVIRIESPHFWKFHGEMVVGTLHIFISKQAQSAAAGENSNSGGGSGSEDASQRVLRQARSILSQAGCSVVTIQVEVDSSGAVAPAVPLSIAVSAEASAEEDHHGHDHGDHHGHSHGGGSGGGDSHHGHSHGSHNSGSSIGAGGGHGHSHGGQPCDGGHGHSHGSGGGASAAANSLASVAPFSVSASAAGGGGHGHSHDSGHGHSHGGGGGGARP